MEEERFELGLKNLHPVIQFICYGLAALLLIGDILVFIVALLDKGFLDGIIGLGILIIYQALLFGFVYACGSMCQTMAYNHDRNQNLAFIFGCCFSLFGIIIYWLYCKFLEHEESA